MVDEDVGAGHLEGDVGDDGAARGDGHGLHVLGHRTQAAEVVDAVEDLTDHVEARGLVWAADAEVETHRLADLGLEQLVRGEEIGRAPGRERGGQYGWISGGAVSLTKNS